jgi:hypothetical protein
MPSRVDLLSRHALNRSDRHQALDSRMSCKGGPRWSCRSEIRGSWSHWDLGHTLVSQALLSSVQAWPAPASRAPPRKRLATRAPGARSRCWWSRGPGLGWSRLRPGTGRAPGSPRSRNVESSESYSLSLTAERAGPSWPGGPRAVNRRVPPLQFWKIFARVQGAVIDDLRGADSIVRKEKVIW